jgi:hypothetical protein
MLDSDLHWLEPPFLHASPNPTNDFPCVLDAENLFHEHGSVPTVEQQQAIAFLR